MSPRTGRPPKEIKKEIRLGLRLSLDTAKKLQYCAEKMNVSRTEIIEKGISLVEEKIKKE